MKLVVLSPPTVDPREVAVLHGLFAAGLERYHVRKPAWSVAETAAWLAGIPVEWRSRLVLHQHHGLVAQFGVGGCHWRDDHGASARPPTSSGYTSRSCHDPRGIQHALGHYEAVFFGPVFPSISKPGYGPGESFAGKELSALLAHRTPAERGTAVLALGGVTPNNATHALEMGFDGVAVLGALWQAADPLRVFGQLQTALHRHAA